MRVYRYFRKIEYAIEAIVNATIYLSSFDEFNDPYETVICFDKQRDSDGIPYQLPEIRYSNEGKAGVGVCCFSKRYDSMLMWGHYANGHRGVCIGYDLSLIPYSDGYSILDNNTYDVFAKDVKYGQKLNILDYDGGYTFGGVEACEMLSCKPKEWEYEEEVRLFEFGAAQKKLSIHPSQVCEVILGLRTSPAHISMLECATQKNECKFGLFRMNLNPNQIGLIKNPYNKVTPRTGDIK